jgi:2-polyprenyl-6-methoxyphenol hydroxylase-like FAD-dependent oxidoreductase
MGVEVLVLEKTNHPRGKPYGDGLTPPALDVLERMGALSEILKRNPYLIKGIRFFSPLGRDLEVTLSRVSGIRGHAYVLPRGELQEALTDYVCGQEGVELLWGRKLVGVLPAEQGMCKLRIRHGKSIRSCVPGS